MNSSEQTSWLPKEEGGYITYGKIASAQAFQTKKTTCHKVKCLGQLNIQQKTQKLRLVNNVGGKTCINSLSNKLLKQASMG